MPRSKEALLSWQEHQKIMRRRKKVDPGSSDFVFSHMNGQPLKSIKTAWKVICDIAKLPDLRFHDLRHTFCSNLILAGADLKEVKEMIGHADIAMTDRYSHLTSKHKLLRQQQLARHYSKP
jgi:site-specific recombinase XerD